MYRKRNKSLKKSLGFLALGILFALIAIASIGGGFYLGIWEMLVGGIVGIIDQCKAPATDSAVVAWSIVKILLCELPMIAGVIFGMCSFSLSAASFNSM